MTLQEVKDLVETEGFDYFFGEYTSPAEITEADEQLGIIHELFLEVRTNLMNRLEAL